MYIFIHLRFFFLFSSFSFYKTSVCLLLLLCTLALRCVLSLGSSLLSNLNLCLPSFSVLPAPPLFEKPSVPGGQTAPSAATLGLFINKLGDYEPGLVCLIGSFLTPTLSHILTFSRTGSANVAIKSPERTIRSYFARMERNENECGVEPYLLRQVRWYIDSRDYFDHNLNTIDDYLAGFGHNSIGVAYADQRFLDVLSNNHRDLELQLLKPTDYSMGCENLAGSSFETDMVRGGDKTKLSPMLLCYRDPGSHSAYTSTSD